MMKTMLFTCSLLFFTTVLPAQNLTVSPGTTLTITTGTVFSIDSLVLIPAADFALTNTNINKSATVTHATPNTYISRVYSFNGISNAFTGNIQVNYLDGAELNGIAENALSLNIHNGTIWKGYTPASRDGTQNFVFTTGLAGVSLSEITLADVAFPLPLNWLSFTAAKYNETVQLQWITAQEQNTRNFIIQHSTDAVSWAYVGTLPAMASGGNGHYNFVHQSPVTGINYYRILQTGLNGALSYSAIRTVNFSSTLPAFSILNNPVTGASVSLRVNTATVLSIYTVEGKLVWTARLNPGLQKLDISAFAKGTYLLVDTDHTAQKLIIQ